jgi:hypothetical protein
LFVQQFLFPRIRYQALALRLLARSFARAADGLRFFSGFAF